MHAVHAFSVAWPPPPPPPPKVHPCQPLMLLPLEMQISISVSDHILHVIQNWKAGADVCHLPSYCPQPGTTPPHNSVCAQKKLSSPVEMLALSLIVPVCQAGAQCPGPARRILAVLPLAAGAAKPGHPGRGLIHPRGPPAALLQPLGPLNAIPAGPHAPAACRALMTPPGTPHPMPGAPACPLRKAARFAGRSGVYGREWHGKIKTAKCK